MPSEGLETEQDDVALRAATLYYVQDLTMAVIARQLDVSPSTVSRLIKYARERGLVEIRVATMLGHPRLAKLIMDRYGVRAEILTDLPAGATQQAARVGRAAARQHANWLVPGISLTVEASGPQVRALADSIVTVSRDMVITAMTGMDEAGASVRVLESIHARLGVEVGHVPAPQFAGDEVTARSLRAVPPVAAALERAARARIAIMEVHDGHVGGLAPGWRGRPRRHSVGLSAEQIRSIEWRIILFADHTHLDVLEWALTEGIATHIMLDESAARALLQIGARS